MVEFFLALVCGLSGLVAGYFLRNAMLATEPIEEPREESEQATSSVETLDRNRLNQVAEQLRTLTARVAADVDEHQSIVQKASNVLCDSDADPTPDSIIDTVSELVKANQEMQTRLDQAQERIHEQAEQIQTAEQKATTDALTKLRNRRAFDECVERCHRNITQKASTLMLLDVDHFKKFNDTYGHLAGDEVLRRVASLLNARLSEVGFVARYGGEEFAVVFEGQEMTACRTFAELTRRAIGEREILFEGQCLRVNACVGLAELQAGESVSQWIERADKGLYKSKQAGRNCGHWMDGDKPIPLTANTSVPSPLSASRVKPATARPQSSAQEIGMLEVSEEEAAELPDELKMKELFTRLTERLSKVSVELFVLVIHRDQEDGTAASDKTILRVIRAATRSLDYIGQLDCGDIIICMPSANETSAVERAQRIRAAVEHSPVVGDDGPLTVSIGIACVSEDDHYEQVKMLAKEAASESLQAGGNQLSVRRAQPV